MPLVFSGREVYINSYTLLKFHAASHYSSADGKPMLAVPQNVLYFVPIPIAWTYSAFAPWKGELDGVIRRYSAAFVLHSRVARWSRSTPILIGVARWSKPISTDGRVKKAPFTVIPARVNIVESHNKFYNIGNNITD
jgi:hypothetical protein